MNQWNKDRDFDYGVYIDQYNQWAAERDFARQSAMDALKAQGSGGGSRSGSGKSSGGSGQTAAQQARMIGDLSVERLDEIAMNIYRNTGMQDPIKRIEATSYTKEQKAYLISAVRRLMGNG